MTLSIKTLVFVNVTNITYLKLIKSRIVNNPGDNVVILYRYVFVRVILFHCNICNEWITVVHSLTMVLLATGGRGNVRCASQYVMSIQCILFFVTREIIYEIRTSLLELVNDCHYIFLCIYRGRSLMCVCLYTCKTFTYDSLTSYRHN